MKGLSGFNPVSFFQNGFTVQGFQFVNTVTGQHLLMKLLKHSYFLFLLMASIHGLALSDTQRFDCHDL